MSKYLFYILENYDSNLRTGESVALTLDSKGVTILSLVL